MRFEKFSFGSIQIDGETYEHDVVIDQGEIRKRKKKPSKKFRDEFDSRKTLAGQAIRCDPAEKAKTCESEHYRIRLTGPAATLYLSFQPITRACYTRSRKLHSKPQLTDQRVDKNKVW